MDNVINGFKFSVDESDGGYKVRVTPPEGQHVVFCDGFDGGVDVVTRDTTLPALGSRVKINGKVHKVKSREFDANGHCFIVDEDTGEKVQWA